jgi:glucose/arabinose dehydrogenase
MARVLGIVILMFSVLAAQAAPLDRLELPAGLRVEVISDALPNARQMALDADRGFLYVGTRREGVVYRVALDDGAVTVIARDLIMPSGIALDTRGRLFIGALNEVRVIAEPHSQTAPTKGVLLTDRLPTERHHGWKYLRFGADGQLYLSVGAPCNVCLEDDPRFASILRMDPETGATEVIAHGVRNSVGLAFHPRTGRLWFTDNGRDMLGDDVPHEELNELVTEGSHYGFPFEHAGPLADPEFGSQAGDRVFVQPRLNIQAHSAALGLAFAGPDTLGGGYADALFIAEHGSWNRSSKVGYRVSVVRFNGQNLVYEPFVTGWLQGEKHWGRPNDVLVAADGSVLVSDDQMGAVYRIVAASPG